MAIIKMHQSRFWSCNGEKAIEERPNGNYDVVMWHDLDLAGLERLHEVLTAVLVDMQGSQPSGRVVNGTRQAHGGVGDDDPAF